MGCFNIVRLPCPKCGTEHLHQSKAGSGDGTFEPLGDAELADVADAAQKKHTCVDCGTTFEVRVQFIATTRRLYGPEA